ncbi:TPA: hypothetical protein ACX3DB_004655 [Vibrio parahaemolyticus]
MKFSSEVFGTKSTQGMDYLSTIVNNIGLTKYSYTSQPEFESMILKDMNSGLKQYWVEILYRAHFASVASIYRNYQWMQGMQTSYDCHLFLPFTSCFRALIESTSDTFDAFNGFPELLSKSNKTVKKILMGKYRKNVGYISQELEDKLIHFSHARRISKNENAPDSHYAKSAAKYIKALDKENKLNLYKCYSELCEYTHPAASSTGHYMTTIDQNTFVFTSGCDQQKIESFCSKYKEAMEVIISCAINPGLITLKLLRKFPEPTCQEPIVDKVCLNEVQHWKDCLKHFT